MNKWNNRQVSYNYVADQLRSIRQVSFINKASSMLIQDLVVQDIQNEFTVHVYETNVRLCLENQDVNYYNQCQSQLMQLYRKGIQSNNKYVPRKYILINLD